MALNDYKINLALPLHPAETLPPDLYPSFLVIHQAIQNLLRGVSEYAGIDPEPL